MATSPDHLPHPYVGVAHRAALLYSFATLLVAVFVEFSAPNRARWTTAAVRGRPSGNAALTPIQASSSMNCIDV